MGNSELLLKFRITYFSNRFRKSLKNTFTGSFLYSQKLKRKPQTDHILAVLLSSMGAHTRVLTMTESE